MRTLREFNRAGPCVPLGGLVKETASRFHYRDHDGRVRMCGKGHGRHLDPCPSCRDHPKTQYPEGYYD